MSEYNHTPKQQELLSDHQVFTDAFELQRQLEDHLFDSVKEAQLYAQQEMRKLDRKAHEAGLLNKPVLLTGFNIAMPWIEHDPETGMESVGPVFITASDQPGADEKPIMGLFYGFHGAVVVSDIMFDDNDDENHDTLPSDESEGDKYQINIHYCVATRNNLTLSSVMGALCAQGNISCTMLDFQSDKQAIDSAAALTKLDEIADNEQLKQLTVTIDDLLKAKNDTNIYGQNRFHRISQALRDHELVHGVNTQYRNVLIDLVHARLGIYADLMYKVGASSLYAKREDDSSIITDSVMAEIGILGIAFAPYYYVAQEGKTVFYDNVESLSLVVEVTPKDPERPQETEQMYGYIPFDKLVSFQRSESN